jgi:alpha-galactosidase
MRRIICLASVVALVQILVAQKSPAKSQLGTVSTPIADGTFDPVQDTVTLRDGSVMRNYYRDTLGVKYYRPIDKSIFPLPPSGLCTWYYYYQDINEEEVRRNARWIAKNLKDYGAQYVQIDDGWQVETKEGRHGSRDWTGTDEAFSGGMAALARDIKALGLTPGIWIAPHGQSNEDVVKTLPGVFLLKPDGTSASESWEGKWLVDPSTPEAHAYLRDLFTTMVKWGYPRLPVAITTWSVSSTSKKGSRTG